MTEKAQSTPTGTVELEESQLEAAQGGAAVGNQVHKIADGSVNKIADGSVRPGVIKAGDGSV